MGVVPHTVRQGRAFSSQEGGLDRNQCRCIVLEHHSGPRQLFVSGLPRSGTTRPGLAPLFSLPPHLTSLHNHNQTMSAAGGYSLSPVAVVDERMYWLKIPPGCMMTNYDGVGKPSRARRRRR